MVAISPYSGEIRRPETCLSEWKGLQSDLVLVKLATAEIAVIIVNAALQVSA